MKRIIVTLLCLCFASSVFAALGSDAAAAKVRITLENNTNQEMKIQWPDVLGEVDLGKKLSNTYDRKDTAATAEKRSLTDPRVLLAGKEVALDEHCKDAFNKARLGGKVIISEKGDQLGCAFVGAK